MKRIKAGIIVFVLVIIFCEVITINSELSYMYGNPYTQQTMESSPIIFWFGVLARGFGIGILVAALSLIACLPTVLLAKLYKYIHRFTIKVLFWVAVPMSYILLFIFRYNYISNADYTGFDGIGDFVLLLLVFFWLILSHVGFAIYSVVTHKKSLNKIVNR